MADNSASLDILELYRWAVQDPETHATVLRIMYESLNPGHKAVTLREDFAGTCADSVAWIALEQGRRAVGVDTDARTLEWAKRRAERLLGPRASQIEFIHGDSLQVGPPSICAADIIAVLNFSIFYLRKEKDLGAYLRHAQRSLAEGGILVLNLFGGPAASRPGTTPQRVTPAPRMRSEPAIPPFEYLWEVRSFEPDTQHLDCRIHFAVTDESDPANRREIRDAFRYDWRLWSVAELMDACRSAGFRDAQFWRHTYDPSKGAAGVFLGAAAPDTVDRLDQWTAYIVAQA